MAKFWLWRKVTPIRAERCSPTPTVLLSWCRRTVWAQMSEKGLFSKAAAIRRARAIRRVYASRPCCWDTFWIYFLVLGGSSIKASLKSNRIPKNSNRLFEALNIRTPLVIGPCSYWYRHHYHLAPHLWVYFFRFLSKHYSSETPWGNVFVHLHHRAIS